MSTATLEAPVTREYSPPLDAGIARYVHILNAAGINTYESCQGGEGHSYKEPAVRFHGGAGEGFRAYSVCRDHALPVGALRRIWDDIDGELTGPTWELTFYRLSAPDC